VYITTRCDSGRVYMRLYIVYLRNTVYFQAYCVRTCVFA